MISGKQAMGGLGSGSWNRLDYKMTTDSQRQVDIRYFRKSGLLRTGTTGTLTWSCEDVPCGSIHFEVGSEAITLRYNYRSGEGAKEDIREVVYFDKTPCNYGGHRLWFLCPECSRRVAVLYGAGKHFLCRHCYDLTYASQNEDAAHRANRRSYEIIERLGGDPNDEYYPEKPKGMHWSTYNRLLSRAQYYAQLADNLLAKQLLRWLP